MLSRTVCVVDEAHLLILWTQTVPIVEDDKAFFVRLGARMVELRKSQDITQVEMAKTLGVSQQTINSCEVDHRRIPVSALATLARALGVSLGAGGGRVRCGR
jgi:DNA-binding XRE family transcriptional regulator